MKPSDMYRRTYTRIMSELKQFSLDSQAGREVQFYLHYISLVSAPHRYQSFVPAPGGLDDIALLEKRLHLYFSTALDQVRAEWLNSDKPTREDDPLMRPFLIFGDLLWNLHARDNYASAPLMCHDFMKSAAFALTMIQRIFPIVSDYASAVKHYETNVSSKPSLGKNVAVILGVLLAIAGLSVIVARIQSYNPSPSPTKSYVNTSATFTPAPSASPSLKSVPTYNGMMVIRPGYMPTCPLTIIADSTYDHYIYLDYQRAPYVSDVKRLADPHASNSYENDIAFIVKAGKQFSLDVPVGVYKLFYATGTTFYGSRDLFGPDTVCYDSKEYLTFNAKDGYYNGHTLTLYATYDGNFETDEINKNTFPLR